jgi:tetratricopeptide (TPR) repeat protein
VIGKDVAVPLLQAITELPEATRQQGLTHLQATEFLYETRLWPECVYTFKHALTQEVAYGSMLPERRRALHARIVGALEALAGDRLAEQVERLAHHALRGEVWDKAVTYLRLAGERAMGQSAHREGVGYFEQALSALRHLPETRETREQAIDLRFDLHSALRPLGESGRILAYLQEAESLAEALDDPSRLGQILGFLSSHFNNRGAHDQAIDALWRALALATGNGDINLHALAYRYLGLTYEAKGDYQRAIESFRHTVAFFDAARRHKRFGRVFLPAVLSRGLLPAVLSRAHLAACHAELGLFAEGSALADEGFRIAEAADHPGSLIVDSWGLGLLALHQGDLPRALPRLERAVSFCKDADFPVYFPVMAAALGEAYTLAGRVADAVPLLTQALEQTIATDRAGFQVRCYLSLGEAHLLAGSLEEAHALAGRALALAQEYQERSHEAYALRLLGDIAAQREPLEREAAETHYRAALSLARELGMRPLMAHCHLGLGMLYRQIGRFAEAQAALSTAVELYCTMDMTFWLPQAEAALAPVG